MSQILKQSLKVQDYEVWVHLGCTKDEQTFTQPVHFTVDIQFEKAVKGFDTDRLADTIDYVELTALIKSKSMRGPFHLIEHLNEEVFTILYEFLKLKQVKGKLIVQAKKIRVPVENLRNGVVFTCEAEL
ncbi:MAG: dihydroneopterin aldolase [Bdellovibrio sp.]|nr:dihydroneopterin aldolase [Bdellovibrio sp.]